MIEDELKKKQGEEAAKEQAMQEAKKVYWKQLFDVYLESSKQFDKQILYIACGSLGISVAFIKDIITLSNATNKGLLIIAWAFMVCVIIVNILSHFSSLKAAKEEMKNLNNPEDDSGKKIDRITSHFNSFAMLLLFVGLILLLVFIGLNI